MLDPFLVEIVGWSAGLTNLCSSVPQLLENLRKPSAAGHQNPLRNALQAGGNLQWFGYGWMIGSSVMCVFALLGFVMASWLLAQVLQAK